MPEKVQPVLPVERLGQFTMVALGARAGLTLFAFAWSVGAPNPGALRANPGWVSALYGFSFVSFAAAALGWLGWVVLATDHARRNFDEPSLPRSTSVVAAYFIPIISFLRPLHHMRALFEASNPDKVPETAGYRSERVDYRTNAREEVPVVQWRVPTPISAWWYSWLASLAVLLSIQLFVFPRGGAKPLMSMARGVQLYEVSAAPPLLLAMFVIRGITLRQRERLRRVMQMGVVGEEEEEEEARAPKAPRRRPRRAARRRGEGAGETE